MSRSGPPARSPKELSDLARETRLLADEIASGLRSSPERLNMPTIMTAIVRGLRNQEAILEALASLGSPAQQTAGATPPLAAIVPSAPAAPRNGASSSPSTASARLRRIEADEDFEGDALEIEPEAPRPRPQPLAVPRELDGAEREIKSVTGPRARAVVCEFDNRDREFARGLSKLNAWLSAGGLGLPFQKRDAHAYLNTGALSEAMLAHVERELQTREGFPYKLGRLVIDGLQGEVVIYGRAPAGGPQQ